jgi:hypothetical protein
MRLLGLILLVLAAGLLGWFGLTTPLGAVIFAVDPPFLNTLQAGVQRNLSPWLWDSVFLPVLEWPSWLIPLALGVLMLVLAPGRRRHG